MRLLERLQKLASMSGALRKSSSVGRAALKAGLAVGAPIAAGGLLLNAPGATAKTYRKSREQFYPATHKAALGLE